MSANSILNDLSDDCKLFFTFFVILIIFKFVLTFMCVFSFLCKCEYDDWGSLAGTVFCAA
ncbi:hypothetical protein [Acetobacterium bakii]|uniref:Uncharacterized protein n=1 Tax=Acetobacterium bakii TaxID=52689 RepID=A0A0L6TWT6_9FIRM|nr:hypothetical protein [Acetobacterium bakii]KNZ40532.1 hypothetical protein AKG39_17140 [Acetobacterium bakii]